VQLHDSRIAGFKTQSRSGMAVVLDLAPRPVLAHAPASLNVELDHRPTPKTTKGIDILDIS
jgi:hypothetical protein